jgi:hypothetical protein
MDLNAKLLEIEQFKELAIEANRLAEKICPLLPDGWTADFIIQWQGLLFSHNDNYEVKPDGYSPKLDFIKVCALVEQAGIKLERLPWIMEESLFCLHGTGWHNPGNKFKGEGLKVEVRQFETKECRLEYEEKTVRVAKLSDDCLNGSNKAG